MRYFFISIIIASLSLETYAQGWELKKEDDSIKVFTRTIATSAVKEFKTVTTVATSSKTMLAIIKDVPSYPKWIEDVSYTETIETNEDTLKFYYQVSLPWPIKDRDLGLNMVIEQSDSEVHVQLSSNPGVVPLKKSHIRMYTVEGEWLITDISPGYSEIEYRFLADPEGSIPAWVINLFIVDGPYKSMQNLREYVKEF